MTNLPPATIEALTLAALVVEFEMENSAATLGESARLWQRDLNRTHSTLAALKETLAPFVEGTPKNYKRNRR